MLIFDKGTILSLLFKLTLSEILSISLCGSEDLLFSECMNTVSILYCVYIEFITLFCTFLSIILLHSKNKQCAEFRLVSFQIYYLLLLVQVLLVIFEAFA